MLTEKELLVEKEKLKEQGGDADSLQRMKDQFEAAIAA